MLTLVGQLMEAYPRLSLGRQRIARQLLDYPGASAFLSISELAATSGVHMSTVTRFAQELGYKGFPHLQSVLRQSLTPSAQIARNLSTRDTSKSLVDRQIDADTLALEAARAAVVQEDVDRAAAWIDGARRVVVIGTGVSASIAAFLEFRLRRLGIDVSVIPHGGYEMEALLGLSPDDVVLAVGFFRAHQEVLAALDYGREVGAKTVAVTDSRVSRLALRADLSIMAPRGPVHELTSLVVPMSIVHALVLCVAARRRERPDLLGNSLERLRFANDRLSQDHGDASGDTKITRSQESNPKEITRNQE